MPKPHVVPPALSAGPFRLADAAKAGVSRSQLRSRRYSRPFRGVHVAGEARELLELCAAALWVLPAGAAFSDETAALLYGLPGPAAPLPLHVTTPFGTALVRRTGLVGHVKLLPESEVMTLGGLPVTTVGRTFVDLAARLSRPHLFALGDAILHGQLATSDDLAVVLEIHRGRRGVARARALLPQLDARAESPMESLTRLLLLDAGLPRPQVNVNLFGPLGEFLGRVDLLLEEAGVVIEFEGDHHRTDRAQFAHDLRRASRLAAAGYVVLRFTASDVLGRPEFVVATVRDAIAAATARRATPVA